MRMGVGGWSRQFRAVYWQLESCRRVFFFHAAGLRSIRAAGGFEALSRAKR